MAEFWVSGAGFILFKIIVKKKKGLWIFGNTKNSQIAMPSSRGARSAAGFVGATQHVCLPKGVRNLDSYSPADPRS